MSTLLYLSIHLCVYFFSIDPKIQNKQTTSTKMEKKYDGTVQSLANQSRRPHKHPKQHTEKEIKLIQNKYQRHKHEGLAQVYRKSIDAGYKRSYESMRRQIKKFKNYEKPKKISYPKSKYEPLQGSYPGEYVQIDVKVCTGRMYRISKQL